MQKHANKPRRLGFTSIEGCTRIYNEDLYPSINDALKDIGLKVGLTYGNNVVVIYSIEEEIMAVNEIYIRTNAFYKSFCPETGDILYSPIILEKDVTGICKIFGSHYEF